MSLKNNSNIDACCRALTQESCKYLYMEGHNPEDTRTNNLLHINLGIHPGNFHGEITQMNGRPLVHSSSDGHIDPQRASGKLICLVQEPHSAPAIVPQNYNPFFLNDRNSPTPPPQPIQQQSVNTSPMQASLPNYMHIPRYSTNPITVTVSQNIPSAHNVPRALQILPQVQSNHYGSPSPIYIRQTSQSSPGRQNTPWPQSSQVPLPNYSPCPLPVFPQSYQPTQYSPKQSQIPQSAFHSPPTSQCTSPYSSPQHQVQPNQLSHQTSHVFMPPSPTVSPHYPQTPPPYPKQSSHSVSYLPYGPGMNKAPGMNKIEITVESQQRPGNAINRSPSPISNQPSQRSPHSAYVSSARPGSPSRAIPGQPKTPYGINPLYITYSQPPTTSGSPTPPRVMMSPSNPTVFKITVARAPTENLLNIVDQEQHPGAPEPIQPISLMPTSGVEKGVHKYHRSSSSGSDDYAYTQGNVIYIFIISP